MSENTSPANSRTQDLQLIKGLIEGLQPLTRGEISAINGWTTPAANALVVAADERLAAILASPITWGAAGYKYKTIARERISVVLFDGNTCFWNWHQKAKEIDHFSRYEQDTLQAPIAQIKPESQMTHGQRPFTYLDFLESLHEEMGAIQLSGYPLSSMGVACLREALERAMGKELFTTLIEEQEREADWLFFWKRRWIERIPVKVLNRIDKATTDRAKQLIRERYSWYSPLDPP